MSDGIKVADTCDVEIWIHVYLPVFGRINKSIVDRVKTRVVHEVSIPFNRLVNNAIPRLIDNHMEMLIGEGNTDEYN